MKIARLIATLGLFVTSMTLVLASSTFAATGASFDFSLSNSGLIHLYPGGNGGNTLTVTLVSGSSQRVVLSCTDGLPSGAFCFFNPGVSMPSYSSHLTIAAGSSVPTGRYTITVSGVSGVLSHTTQFTLLVTPAPALGGTSTPVDTLGLIIPYTSPILLLVSAAVAIAVAVHFGRVRPVLK